MIDPFLLAYVSHCVLVLASLKFSRGRLQLLELLLQFGADSRVRASNGWTAADFCKKTGQLDCQELLEEVRASEGRPRTPSLPPAPTITPGQQRLVELYLSTVDEDRVDCDLVLHLLLHIHTTQGPGAVLVFLPGYEDIAGVRDLVGREQALSDVNLLVLHSQVVFLIILQLYRTKNKFR